MAITGRFDADFTSFVTACANAEVQLRSFETGSNKVESALGRMTDSFSGRKIITDATLMTEAVERVGGTSKLTEKELARVGATANEATAKLKAMGVDVPPGLQKIADETRNANTAHTSLLGSVKDLAVGFGALFTVRAAWNFAKDVIADASALVDLSQQTHISVEELQILAGGMSEFGVDADTLGKGLFTLSRKIAGEDDSVANGLHKMGMSLEDVKGLNGRELFLKIMDGLATLQGGLRDDTASEIFGSRLGMAMAGASEGIRGAMDTWGEHNALMTGPTSKALDHFDEEIKRAEKSLGSMVANIMGPVAEGFNAYIEMVQKAGFWTTTWARLKDGLTTSFAKDGTAFTDLQAKTLGLAKATDTGAAATSGAAAASREHVVVLTAQQQATNVMAAIERDAAAALTTGQLANLAHLKDIGALNAQNAVAVGVSAAQFAKYTADQTKATAATAAAAAASKIYRDAWVELNSTGVGWKGTLDTINGSVVAGIKYYLEAGAAQDKLATAYGLSAVQIKAVASSLAEETAARKINTDSLAKTKELLGELNTLRIQHGGTATQAAIAANEAWFNDEVAKLSKSDANYKQHYDALAALAKEKLSGIAVNWTELGTHSRQALQETADQALAMYAAALSASGNFTDGYIKQLEATATAAQKAADQWGLAVDDTLQKVDTGAQQATASVQQLTISLEKAVPKEFDWTKAYAAAGLINMGTRLTPSEQRLRGDSNLTPLSFAEGTHGPRNFGTGTLAVLHDWESVVPGRDGPGAGGGTTIVQNTFYVNGTGDDVGRAAMAYISREMKTSRKWPGN